MTTWRDTVERFFKLRLSDKTKIAEALGCPIDLRNESDLDRWLRFLRGIREARRESDLARELAELELRG